MRVFYRASQGRTGTVYERTGPAKFCCVEMCRWWGVLIGFGMRGCERSTISEVRTDNGSLSPEGVFSATGSPPQGSAGTDSGRVVRCRLIVQELVRPTLQDTPV